MAFIDLDIRMNGECVGTARWTRPGVATLQYSDAWLQSPLAGTLSTALPSPTRDGLVTGPQVHRYFDNLLPCSTRIRDRLHQRFGTATAHVPDLLAAVGGDCAGAVQLLPAGTVPQGVDRIDSTPLTNDQVGQLLADVTVAGPQPRSLIGDLRVAIAGAQEKAALLRIGTQWHLPEGATPTTHILKLPMGLVGNIRADMSDSVENEWLCMTMLARMGFNVAPVEMAQFGPRKALVVERFDRRWMDGGRWIARLPQEDFCQATGTPGDLKYESDGGPGIRAALTLLAASDDPQHDRLQFVLSQLAFWLMAATDGHAKNFSIHLLRGGGYRLTPLYDVLSIWPIIGNAPSQVSPRRAKLAMALRGKNVHYHLHEVRLRHWQALAQASGVPGAFDRMVGLVLQVPQVLDEAAALLPPGFPMPVFDAIRRGMLAQANRFVDELA